MQWMICTKLDFVRSVSLDIWRIKRYACFWPLWFSKPTISFTVTTFSSVRVCFSLPVSWLWSVLCVSQISVNNIPTLSLLQFIFKNYASIFRKLYFRTGRLQVLNRGLVSTAKWHITSPVYRQCINKLARLAWKWLQIGTDMLLIITSTGDELLRNVNINDLEWPLTPHIKGFSEFFAIWGCDAHFKTELCWKSCR